MQIERLSQHKDCIKQLSRWHFDQWGQLTGAHTFDEYVRVLEDSATNGNLPMVLVAIVDGMLAGSATLLTCDLPIRNHLSPWLGQLFVAPQYRSNGIGSSLVRAATVEARSIGYGQLYLYTSGTLPLFYERLGWSVLEKVDYLGKERSVLYYDHGPIRQEAKLPNPYKVSPRQG